MVQKVDDESFNVRTVVVLVRHNHDVSVAKGRRVRVRVSDVESHDFHDVLNFGVTDDRGVAGIPNVQQLAFEWEHAIFCLLYTSPSPRDGLLSRMPSSA